MRLDGCSACFGEDPAKAYEQKDLETTAELVDDSHFAVSIRLCRACGQRFAWVFTERVMGGPEDQHETLLIPITVEESDALVAAAGAAAVYGLLGRLPARRSLFRTDLGDTWYRDDLWIPGFG